MIQHGRCVLLLTLLLALGVVALEAPELSTLSDDVSNDVVVACLEDSIPGPALRPLCRGETARPILNRIAAFPILSKKHLWFGPSLDASSKAGRDVLRFLSLQRK